MWSQEITRNLKYARDAAEFLLSRMKAKDGSLMHRYRDGEAAIRGFLEDYAFLCWGLVKLYEHASMLSIFAKP